LVKNRNVFRGGSRILPSPHIRSRPLNPDRGPGERCKLPQQGPGGAKAIAKAILAYLEPRKGKDLGSPCALNFFLKLALMAIH